jgi:hypothetical protein
MHSPLFGKKQKSACCFSVSLPLIFSLLSSVCVKNKMQTSSGRVQLEIGRALVHQTADEHLVLPMNPIAAGAALFSEPQLEQRNNYIHTRKQTRNTKAGLCMSYH